MASHVGTFTGPGTATTQTVTGVGFTPGVEIVLSALSTTTDTGDANANIGIGAAVSSTERATGMCYTRNGLNTSQTAGVFQSNNFLSSVDNSDNAVDLFDFNAQNADGFSVDWGTAASYITPYLALQSTVSAKVGFFDLNNSLGPQAITGVGFTPGLVLFFTTIPNTTEGALAQSYFSFGAGDGTSVFSIAARDVDAQSRSDAARYMTEAFAFTQISASAVLAQFSTVTMGVDGFTVLVTTPPASPVRVAYVALGGPNFRARIGGFTRPAANGYQTYTFPGFQPDSVIIATTQDNQANFESVRPHFNVALGLADSGARNASISAISLDNRDPNTTFARKRTSNTRCISLQNGDGPGSFVTNSAILTAMTSTGFTLNWDLAGTLNVRFAAIAIQTESPILPATASLAGASDLSLNVAGNVTIVLDIATALSFASGEDLAWRFTMGDGGIEAPALGLEGASDIELSWTEDVNLEIEPAELGLNGSGVSGLNCQCLTVSTQYEFGQGTQIVDIITEAFERCGIDGTAISGTMLDSARRSLQYMFVDWANNGPNLFLTYLYTIDLAPGTLSYTLPENTIYVTNAATRQTNGSENTDLLIGAISRAEYLALPRKAQTSNRPTQFYLERSRVPVIYPWPVLQENSECQLLLYLLRATSDIEKFCGAIDGPQRIMNAAAAGLAAKLATKYAWERRQELKIESDEAYGLMIGEDRERVPYRVTINNPWGL